ncbi:serine phosphatase RsbU (regulator of sigma subunit) [Actinomycetospora succinea]|uniref:Serine phosphatase RsbU (Regulator of sigma subunit) n=1 Tax=Actinomycetospora succinea TaxID=663603 RepID=A0A4R6USN5_9PSEU|nr:GAF domain-containing SpoIIE family protein phosphatase [Actinomycetospora succinea]TDQ46384.1 serine phosphatase RsbU (regulator of sigma subunit) [Actinomycetospora succinea]
MRALARSGLNEAPDPVLDGIAERVRRWLDVPVALVSLVQSDQQVFPGQAGLPEPWAERRRTPLSHSFCQHVIATSQPLIVSDSREDPRVRDNLAIRDLSVIAYAGMPLTDAAGHVLGSLCAIDQHPRAWTPRDLELLRGLAEGCSAELRLRLARVDAEEERRRRDSVERDLSTSYRRSQSLLAASQAFSDVSDLAGLRARLADLITPTLRPSSVALALQDEGGGVYRLHDGRPTTPPDGAVLPWTEPSAAATTAPHDAVVDIGSGGQTDGAFPTGVGSWLAVLDAHTALVVRLTGRVSDLGLMVLGWPVDPHLSDADRLFAATVAGYVAQVVPRVRFVEGRVLVAHEMQAAMLAPLPAVSGVEIAARYQPADDREDVGGDWYDASLLPGATGESPPIVAASVGDVVGHTLDSAVRMGQMRSMLRQAAWDVAGPPSRALAAVERANAGDGLGLVGTAVLVHLRRRTHGGWSMTWTNAGHPPPLIVAPDGSTALLEGVDPLFGFPVAVRRPRIDHEVVLDDGCTVFLHTDGLIERPGGDLDEATARLRDTLTRHAALSPQDLVDTVVSELAPGADDDVVALAIRLEPAPRANHGENESVRTDGPSGRRRGG